MWDWGDLVDLDRPGRAFLLRVHVDVAASPIAPASLRLGPYDRAGWLAGTGEWPLCWRARGWEKNRARGPPRGAEAYRFCLLFLSARDGRHPWSPCGIVGEELSFIETFVGARRGGRERDERGRASDGPPPRSGARSGCLLINHPDGPAGLSSEGRN